jgi:hypothetical protein
MDIYNSYDDYIRYIQRYARPRSYSRSLSRSRSRSFSRSRSPRTTRSMSVSRSRSRSPQRKLSRSRSRSRSPSRERNRRRGPSKYVPSTPYSRPYASRARSTRAPPPVSTKKNTFSELTLRQYRDRNEYSLPPSYTELAQQQYLLWVNSLDRGGRRR